MISDLKNCKTQDQLNKAAGPEFSFKESIRMGGTGSAKTIYLKGASFVEKATRKNLDTRRMAFELRPESIIGRLIKTNSSEGFVLPKAAISKIEIEIFRVRVRYRLFWWKEMPEGLLKFFTNEGPIEFFIPARSFKSIQAYFIKDWLKTRTQFIESPRNARNNDSNTFLELITLLPGAGFESD